MTISLEPTGGRHCGSCTACCTLVPVATLKKPAGRRCEHARHRRGCAIYHDPSRPEECGFWSCKWLTDPATHGMMRPDRAHYVIDPLPDDIFITPNEGGPSMTVSVMQVWIDPGHPGADRDPRLRAYIEHIAETLGIPTILRWNNQRAKLLGAPCLTDNGQWQERDLGKPNPNIGRYSQLPPHLQAPLE